MTAPLERSRRHVRQQHICVQALLIAAAFLTPAMSAHAEDIINVFVDQAKVARLPDRVTTLVVGNPLIADVTLQRGGVIVITGKGYGVTNMIALDASGAVLREESIEVRGVREDVIVVYRGINRETYSCTPNCDRRITLGDGADFFRETLAESAERSSSAQGAGAQQQPR
jgi:Flp pilus assembly secretin CpaC